jgi:hypothetical protein
MEGTGQFVIVTLEIKGAMSGDLFRISAEANEGQIPLTIGFPSGSSHTMTGDE